MTDPATEYAEKILAGKKPAGPHIIAACKRHMDDLDKASKRGYKYSEDAAERGVAFYESILSLSGGQYEELPFKLFDWQQFAARSIYGWIEERTGFRRFRKVYIETGKGSGKSPFVSGMGIRAICADAEPRAQGYVIARNSEQAKATFDPAVAMVNSSPLLNDRLVVYGGSNPVRIVDQKSMSFLQRVAGDTKGRHSGPIPHIVIVDEYHEHDTPAMRDLYAAGVKNRRQPLVVMITNAGVSMQSPCGQEHRYACRVASQEIEDDQYFSLIFSIDKEDDPMNDESCWIKANPSLCINPEDEKKEDVISIPSYRYIREQVKEAVGMPSKRSLVERLNFCRWVDAEEPWIDREIWEACEGDLSPEADRLEKPCWIGLDLSLKTDLTAATRTWIMGEGVYETETFIWTPRDTLSQRSERDGVPYDLWAEEKDIHFVATAGSVVDYQYVARFIIETYEKYNLAGVAYDPWKIEVLKTELERAGAEVTREKYWPGIYICAHPQGFIAGSSKHDSTAKERLKPDRFWMPRSIEYAEEVLFAGSITINRSPCLRMAVNSMQIIQDAAGNRRPTKTKSEQRIDPAVSFLMSVGACVQSERIEEATPDFDVKDFTL